MLKQILIGLMVSGLGGVIIFYSQGLFEAFGRMDRAEKNLGSTKTLYILMGFCMIIVGCLIMFGVIPV